MMWQCATIRISDGDWERAGPYTVLIRAGDFGMQIYRNSRSFNVLAGDEGERWLQWLSSGQEEYEMHNTWT